MNTSPSGESSGILVLVRTPLDGSSTTLLRKILSNPQNSAVFLDPAVPWENLPEERVYRLDEKTVFWSEVYDLVRKSPKILTLA
ncbi:hypothetical protein [Leptospirillum ferriphilum]|uniref:Uncharacterized protein n=1 Tax=Leptospirillum ferriphilum (strain ML-04) TaxID=1048260 RepID=J9Z9Q3_LEPFM|nr:hypothetical protein [Leptospirillum ferriphilum]AFS52427.1 hypothetical protein LFML04_0182 [Leptospirillum ferriphilum ML-04]